MKKLLVVVDYQHDFVDGSLGFPGAEKLEDAICGRVARYRLQGADIAFTFDTHDDGYLETQEGKRLPVAHCLRDTEGWSLYGRVAGCLTSKDQVFHKSAFGSSELAEFARKGGYDVVELCGLVSNICVLSNAVLIKAALPEAEIIVDARCTACADSNANQKALDVMEGLQISVINRE